MISKFHQLLTERWDLLLEKGTVIDYKEDQYLFYEGHHPYGLFVVLSGKVGLFKKKENQDVCLGQLPLNYEIGMDFLACQLPYDFSARAETPSKVLFIPKSILQEALFHPERPFSEAVPHRELRSSAP